MIPNNTFTNTKTKKKRWDTGPIWPPFCNVNMDKTVDHKLVVQIMFIAK